MNSSVHLCLNKLKNWNNTINFLICFNLQISFNSFNKSRLKNIFLRIIEDHRIWDEIEKMWNAGLINFSIPFFKDENFFSNFFSKFIFNLYLTEIDLYINNSLVLYFDSFFYNSKRFSVFSLSKITGLNFVSLKVRKSLINLKNLKQRKFLYLSNLTNKYYSINASRFEKKINYVRYSEAFIIGVTGSKNFSLEIKEKVLSFLKGNLYLSVSFCNLNNVLEKNIFFLGHSIQLVLSKTLFKFNQSFIYRNKFTQRLKLKKKIKQRFIFPEFIMS